MPQIANRVTLKDTTPQPGGNLSLAVFAYKAQVLLDNPAMFWMLVDTAAPAIDSNPTPQGPTYPSTSVHGTITWAGSLGPYFGAGAPTGTPTFNVQSGGIVLPSIPANLLTKAMTFEALVKVTADTRSLLTTGSYEQATTRLAPSFDSNLMLYNIVGRFPNIGLTLTTSTPSPTSFFLEAWLGGSATRLGTVGLGSWVHLAGSYAGFGSSSRTLYVNGASVGVDTAGAAANFTDTMRIGEDERWTGYDTTVQGTIFGAAIYNYALTAQQIQNHYQALSVGQSEIWVPFPTGFQPWDIPASFGNIAGWFAETYQGGGLGKVPTVGKEIIVALSPGTPATKYWAYPSAINPAG